MCFNFFSTAIFGQQVWPPANSQPSNQCGDVFIVLDELANGDLEIAVNYHFKSPNAGFTNITSLNINLVEFGGQSLSTDPNSATYNTNLTNGTVGLTYSGGYSYSATQSSPTGFHYNQNQGIVELFRVKYLNNVPPYNGGCLAFTPSVNLSVGGTSCSLVTTTVWGEFGAVTPLVPPNTFELCTELQASQLITIGDNVSAPPMNKNACLDDKGNSTPPLVKGISNVDIAISSGSNTFCSGVVTDAAGDYTSCAVPRQNYKVTASKKCPSGKNGCLSTLDIVHISKHHSGAVPFTQPWQFIAGDVNNNGTVEYDLSDPLSDSERIRNHLLRGKPITNGKCWEFYPVAAQNSYLLAAAQGNAGMLALFNANGSSWSQSIDLQNPTSNITDADFYGVQVGDVNASCICNGLMKPSFDTDNEIDKTNLTVHNFKTNSVSTIPFLANKTQSLIAFDMTLQINDNADFLGVTSSLPKFDKNAYNWDEETRTLRIIWLSEGESDMIEKGKDLFTLKLKSNNSTVKDLISIENLPDSKLFTEKAEEEINIDFKQSNILHTNVAVNLLPESVMGDIVIYDTYGRILLSKSINTNSVNQILNDMNLEKGLYIYSFQSEHSKFSGKFISLK